MASAIPAGHKNIIQKAIDIGESLRNLVHDLENQMRGGYSEE